MLPLRELAGFSYCSLPLYTQSSFMHWFGVLIWSFGRLQYRAKRPISLSNKGHLYSILITLEWAKRVWRTKRRKWVWDNFAVDVAVRFYWMHPGMWSDLEARQGHMIGQHWYIEGQNDSVVRDWTRFVTGDEFRMGCVQSRHLMTKAGKPSNHERECVN